MMKNEVHPLEQMHQWIENEKVLGSSHPNRVVLATAAHDGIPHSRIVVIRKITSEGIIFFTQKGTRKVTELTQNPYASMTLWLALQQRQVILEGTVVPLTDQENRQSWATMPREQQLRFFTYAPTSGQPLASLSILDEKLEALEKKVEHDPVPMSDEYRGFHLIAQCMYFYTLGSNSFSEVLKYEQDQGKWERQLLSP